MTLNYESKLKYLTVEIFGLKSKIFFKYKSLTE